MAANASHSPQDDIDKLVAHFNDSKHLIAGFLEQVLVHLGQSSRLRKLIHTTRSRVKDPDHLRDKLLRKQKAAVAQGKPFDITPENLFQKITDLAGIRLLHLYTRQFEAVDAEIRSIIDEQKIPLIEGPFARTWDDEYREYFEKLGVQIQKSPTMYTSVHYVIASGSKTTVTCEIQVRTLMEEVWGEVDHTVNYPHPADSVACKEQIRALARATSSATRLVDAIFATVDDIAKQKVAASTVGPSRPRKASKRKKR